MSKQKQIAIKALNSAIKHWDTSTADLGLKKAFEADRHNMTIVRELIETEEYGEASAVAWNLDTIVREAIPDVTWEFIKENT